MFLQRQQSFILLVLSALLMLNAGCLHAKRSQYFTYDAQNEQMQILFTYEGLYGDEPQDLEYLKNVYSHREYILPYTDLPMGPMGVGQHQGLFLTPQTSVRAIPLHSPRSPVNESTVTPEIWQKLITIKPGQFYLNDNDRLSYYHVAVIEKKAMLYALDALALQASGQLMNAINLEKARRRKETRRYTWDQLINAMKAQAEVTREQLNQADGKDEPRTNTSALSATTQPGDSGDYEPRTLKDFLMVLEERSLKLLEHHLNHHERLLQIKDNKLSVHIPLSEPDQEGMMKLFKTMVQISLYKSHTKAYTEYYAPELMEKSREASKAISWKAANEAVQLSMDMPKSIAFVTLMNFTRRQKEIMEIAEQLNQEKKQVQRAREDTLKYVKENLQAELPRIEHEKLYEQFLNGKLKTIEPAEIKSFGEGIPE